MITAAGSAAQSQVPDWATPDVLDALSCSSYFRVLHDVTDLPDWIGQDLLHMSLGLFRVGLTDVPQVYHGNLSLFHSELTRLNYEIVPTLLAETPAAHQHMSLHCIAILGRNDPLSLPDWSEFPNLSVPFTGLGRLE